MYLNTSNDENMNMDLKFTDILRERLKGQNLSAIAREVHIPKSLLHDWVHGDRLPSLKNINHVKALASYLGLSLDEVFFGTHEKSIISSITFEDEGRQYRINIEKINKEK